MSRHIRADSFRQDATGAPTITATRNEILFSMNKPDDFIPAIVEFPEGNSNEDRYIRRHFHLDPDVGAKSVIHDFAGLPSRAKASR